MRVPRSACDQSCSFRSSLIRSPRGMVLSSWFGVQAHSWFIGGAPVFGFVSCQTRDVSV